MSGNSCCGRVGAFLAHCDRPGSVERAGKWYCWQHDPEPVPAPDVPVYVWEVWDYGMDCPSVKRYTLVKMGDAGGCTVLVRGHRVIIRPMIGKRFYTTEADMLAAVRGLMEKRLASHRSAVASLESKLAKPDAGIVVEVTPDAQKVRPAPKLE